MNWIELGWIRVEWSGLDLAIVPVKQHPLSLSKAGRG